VIAITIDAIRAAHRGLKTIIRQTPCEVSPSLSKRLGSTVYLKQECLQKTGSFKIRGAYHKMASLDGGARRKGVVTSSAGNHGQGIGFAAQLFDVPARIFVPETTPRNKIEAIGRYPVELIVTGKLYDEAHAAALADAEKSGRTYIGAFEDPAVIAGHGTLGLEILQAVPDIDAVLLPVGGGGLIAGCATAMKAIKPDIRVIGCQSVASCAMARSLEESRVYTTFPSVETIAEGLEGGISDVTYRLGRHLIDDMVLVEEADIRAAIRFLLAEHRRVVEGSGAVGVAALLSDRLPANPGKLAIVLSGGNLDYDLLKAVVNETGSNPGI
jgi:threonine dehydratase